MVDEPTFTDAAGDTWRVVDVFQADVRTPKRAAGEQRGSAGARLFLRADDRRVVRCFYFQTPPGGYRGETHDERATDDDTLRSQLRRSRVWARPER